MTLTFTLSDGRTFEAKMVKGDRMKVSYTNSEGKKLIYWICITNKENLVAN